MKSSYFKLAIQMLKSNWFFSALSISAIALTVMFVLIISMRYEMAIASQAPEVNLDRTVFLERASIRDTINNGSSNSAIGQGIADVLKKELKTPIAISLVSQNEWNYVGDEGVSSYRLIYTDADYWVINQFTFLRGRSFTKEEVEVKSTVVVLTEKLAKLLFPNEENVLGRNVEIFGVEYQVIGVVKNVSSTCRYAFGELWIPLTCSKAEISFMPEYDRWLGDYTVMLMGKSSDDITGIKREVKQQVANIAKTLSANKVLIVPGPSTSFESFFRRWDYSIDTDNVMSWLQILGRILMVMLIPAINLIAINLTWIGERAQEIGLRKAFGATRWTLVRQLLAENTIITLAGGFVGLILALICASVFKGLLFMPQFGNPTDYVEVSISVLPFVITIAACFCLSILSGLIPAFKITKTEPAAVLKGGVR